MPGILETIAGPLLEGASGIIDQFVESDEEKARAQAILMEAQVESQKQATKAEIARAKTVRAEIAGHSWLQRNWRPLTALTFVFIVANNFVLRPYFGALFGVDLPALDVPQGMWALLTTMIGGYTIGRSYEKGKVAANDVDSITDQVLQRIGDARS